MKHLGTQTIKTKRLVLRPFNMDDALSMFDNYCCDSDVCKYMTWNVHKNIDETRKILNEWIKSYENCWSYQWAITFKDDINNVIGSISILDTAIDLDSGEVGYCIAKKYWHQGITSEALKAVIDFAFSKVGFRYLIGRHDINNPHSGLVMLKCKMIKTGQEVNYFPLKQKTVICNTYIINND